MKHSADTSLFIFFPFSQPVGVSVGCCLVSPRSLLPHRNRRAAVCTQVSGFMQLCRRTEKPPSILEGGSHLLRFLRGIVLRGIVLRGIVLRGIVLRGIVLRGQKPLKKIPQSMPVCNNNFQIVIINSGLIAHSVYFQQNNEYTQHAPNERHILTWHLTSQSGKKSVNTLRPSFRS